MAGENRYPSPEPTSTGHPYHNSQQPLHIEADEHNQHAPTALMQDHPNDNASLAQSLQYSIPGYGMPHPSTPQQMAQQGLEVDGHDTDPSAKKKTKVSRACDECRRKKVRCDAESDQPGIQCGNCKRANITCQFSRQPQKRGPSKGYIKELAERVSRLEYPGAPTSEIAYTPTQNESQNYSPRGEFGTAMPRKRTHSMADGAHGYLSGSEQLQEYVRHGNATPAGPAYTLANMDVTPAPTYESPKFQDEGLTYASELKEYHSKIHETFPLLPDSPVELKVKLDNASPATAHAFIAALAVVNHNATSPANERLTQAAITACSAIKSSGNSENQKPHNTVHLWTLMLMAIGDDLAGATSCRNSTWLGSAVAFANSLQWHKVRCSEKRYVDESSRVIRRAWVILVMLDRWHAAGNCSETLINDECTEIVPTDQIILGSKVYHLLRMSLTLGHLNSAFLHHASDLTSPQHHRPMARALSQLIRGEVSRVGETLTPLLPQMPLVNMAYSHLRLLAEKSLENFASASDASVIDSALEIVHLLRANADHPSPLAHHFAGLAAVTLVLALDIEPAPATEGLSQLLHLCDESALLPPSWRTSISSYINTAFDVKERKNSGNGNGTARSKRDGLQHLADAAVGADAEGSSSLAVADGSKVVDWSILLSKGYLKAFE